MLVTAPVEAMILILLPFFAAVVATIVYTDNVVRSKNLRQFQQILIGMIIMMTAAALTATVMKV